MAEDKMLQAKLQKFSDEIMNIARTECSTIQQELASDLKKRREALQAAAEGEAARYLNGERQEIDAAARAAAFAEKEKLRGELFAIRERYRENVFAQAASRLKEFAAGPEYGRFLLEKAQRAARENALEGCTILLREEDMAFAGQLAALFAGAVARPTKEIGLGGLILLSADGRRRLDLSLDSALAEQQEWFYSHSRLDITL